MAKKNQFDVGKIHYLHIRDLAFNYLIPENTLLSRERSESIRSNMEIVKTIGLSEKIIRLLFTVELKAYEKGKKEASATYTTEHLFKVDNIEELSSKNEGEFEIDIALDNTLTGLAYSTVRGKLHEKFIGTLFSDFILPIVKPADLGKPNS